MLAAVSPLSKATQVPSDFLAIEEELGVGDGLGFDKCSGLSSLFVIAVLGKGILTSISFPSGPPGATTL